MHPDLQAADQWFAQHEREIWEDFFHFLRFPTISTDPQYATAGQSCAEWLCQLLRDVGFQVELWPTGNFPVIYATLTAASPDAPTLLLYHHYDVQPADPLNLWKSPPFTPTLRDGYIYARGALDNKGQCFYSLQAIRAFLAEKRAAGINIKLFIEGEEEAGSVGATALLAQKKRQLRADALIVVDVDLPQEDVPAIILGARGIVTLEVVLRNAATDLHSGTHGGIAMNPIQALVSLLARMWDGGKIAIPGIYAAVDPVAAAAKFDQLFDRQQYSDAFGVRCFAGEAGYDLVASNTLRPTLEINGICGGYTGSGFKTVIPSQAMAKISCRLVPQQTAAEVGEQIARFLKTHAPAGMEVVVRSGEGGSASRSDPQTPIARVARRAFEDVFAAKCLSLLAGGSVPIVNDLQTVSGADMVMLGMGLADDCIHAPNERFSQKRFRRGFLTLFRILQLFSAHSSAVST